MSDRGHLFKIKAIVEIERHLWVADHDDVKQEIINRLTRRGWDKVKIKYIKTDKK